MRNSYWVAFHSYLQIKLKVITVLVSRMFLMAQHGSSVKNKSVRICLNEVLISLLSLVPVTDLRIWTNTLLASLLFDLQKLLLISAHFRRRYHGVVMMCSFVP
jgi:hypothetical protein